MPSYPNTIPALGTLTGSDYPQAAHTNNSNREVEAVCTELGVNPRAIDDTVAPGATPASVAAYLDMQANIVKTMMGVLSWPKAAAPAREILAGSGLGGQVPATSQQFLAPFGRGLVTTIPLATFPMTFSGQFLLWSFRIEILTAQPGDVSATLQLEVHLGAGNYSLFTIQPSAPAGVYWFGSNDNMGPSGNGKLLNFVVNNGFCITVTNNSTSASAQIGSWSIEAEMAG